MHIGVDADLVGRDGSGNETHLRGMVDGLLEALSGGAPEVLSGGAPGGSPPGRLTLFGSHPHALGELAAGRADVVRTPSGVRGDLVMGRAMARAGVQVALATYNAPLGLQATKVTVVHDIAYLRVPETFPRLLRRRIAASVSRSITVSDLVTTVSDFSRSELLAAYPRLPPQRVVVTPNAAGPQYAAAWEPGRLAALRSRYGLADRFVLAVGNLQPRKNLPRLIEAAGALGVPLVVAGRAVWGGGGASRAQEEGAVRWLGYVPGEDLPGLYRAATVFCYPSLYEGFGLPVLEAMAAGAPVVTSNTSALPEVAGGGAVLVDPLDVKAIAAAVGGLWDDAARRAELAAAGPALAARYSWRSSADALLHALAALPPR